MAWLILAVVVLLIALMVLKVLQVVIGLVAILVALIVLVTIGERLDRGRQRGTHNPGGAFDANKPNFYGRSNESQWEPPTPYIDHPTGGGPPPGVDTGDDRKPPK